MSATAIPDTGLNKDMSVTGHRSSGTGNPPWGRVSCSFPAAKVARVDFETHTTDTHGLVARVCGSQHWRNYGVSV